MNRTRRISPSSTVPAPKRVDVYKLAAVAIRIAATKHGYTTKGNLKTNPQDSARRTALFDAEKNIVGYGYCSPSGAWWLSRGKYSHCGIFDEGKVEEPPITPAATVLCTAVIGNRHEKALVLA